VSIDAREAGARGDGATDDRPAVQAALDRLAGGGGVLRFPAGAYTLGAPLMVRGDGIVLRGDGATLRAGERFAGGAPLVRTAEGGAGLRHLEVSGLRFDGGGRAGSALLVERAQDVTLRANHVRGLRSGGPGAIVVRSAGDTKNDTGGISVADNVLELEGATSGVVLRNVVNCRVSGNRVEGRGAEGGHGLDLTLSGGCTVSDNMLFTVDVGLLADEANHIQAIGNYAYAPRTGFQAAVRPDGKRAANNVVYVNNRVLSGGRGFVVRGSGMILIGNYAAFLKPGPAIWVQKGGSHDAVVANNPSVAEAGGIRFDASDGVVVANVPISNGTSGIEVNGQRVSVTANAVTSSPTGIQLGDGSRGCSVLGNSVTKATKAGLVLGGTGHRVRDNVAAEGTLPEMGPGALYGTGEADVRGPRTAIASAFPDDRYLVDLEWSGDPGGREWITDKTAAGFVITLPGAPPGPVRARWIARGL
jgi:hypothetical protein